MPPAGTTQSSACSTSPRGRSGSTTKNTKCYCGERDSLAREVSLGASRHGSRERSIAYGSKKLEVQVSCPPRSVVSLTKNTELTAEEITARRRAIRKQFKQERAEAVAAAEAEAEASFAVNPETAPVITTVIPSSQTADLRRRLQDTISAETQQPLPELTEEEMPDNQEHLQLSLQEAFFLAWTVHCLRIHDSDTGRELSLQEFWNTCFRISSLIEPQRTDNSFLVHYAVYHHFRSLGWVVKPGIKFCVDYLLYKRGPVFHHAEFAVMIVPVYEETVDRERSPRPLPNSGPLSWQWFSTVNRANAQVMKVST